MDRTKTKLFPLVAADVALFCVDDERLRVLLVRRANAPEAGRWALPGGVLEPDRDRSLEDTARRVLRDKVRVDVPYLEQVATFSGPDRDPRGWSVDVLFYALLPRDRVPAVAGSKTEAIEWCNAGQPGHRLAFDHAAHLARALRTLRARVRAQSLPLHLLPGKFTLTQLQRTCEAIVGEALDKSAFRRRLRDCPDLAEIPGEFQRGIQRPAQLYRAAPGFAF